MEAAVLVWVVQPASWLVVTLFVDTGLGAHKPSEFNVSGWNSYFNLIEVDLGHIIVWHYLPIEAIPSADVAGKAVRTGFVELAQGEVIKAEFVSRYLLLQPFGVSGCLLPDIHALVLAAFFHQVLHFPFMLDLQVIELDPIDKGPLRHIAHRLSTGCVLCCVLPALVR